MNPAFVAASVYEGTTEMQSLLRLAFPPQCICCAGLVAKEFGLCGTCYRDTPFITGLACNRCGVPLPGEEMGVLEFCDDCMTIARPWSQGRSALLYKANARRLVLAFKHGDRIELAKPLAKWMAGAAQDLWQPDTVIVPIPAHPFRLIKRRYNQAAILSKALAKHTGRTTIPDLLRRVKQTKTQDGMTQQDRFANMADAIKPANKSAMILAGRAVLLVDDVVTSGATMAAAADACLAMNARRVDVLSLARVAKDA